MELAMGIFLIGFAITFLVNKKLKFEPTNFNAITGGAVAGFLAGIIGTGGAIRGATLAAFNLKKGMFVGTPAGIDFAIDLSRTIIYLVNGYLDKSIYGISPYSIFWHMQVLGSARNY